MRIDSPATYFQSIAARGWEPQLVRDVGTWQIEVEGAEGAETWSIHVDHGALQVRQGPDPAATARFRLSHAELLRLANGDEHENLMTALLRGAIRELRGDLGFAQKLAAIIPLYAREAPTSDAPGRKRAP